MQQNQDIAAQTDRPWGTLYRIGGISALLFVALLVGVLTTVGMLIVSVVMLPGVFPRWMALRRERRGPEEDARATQR